MKTSELLRWATLQQEFNLIERLAGLGARPNAISKLMGDPKFGFPTVQRLCREYLGTRFPQGKPGSAPLSELGKMHVLHSVLIYLLTKLAERPGASDALVLAEAYEVYYYLSKNIDEPKLSIESAMALVLHVELKSYVVIECRQCKVPRTVPSATIRSTFVCTACKRRDATSQPSLFSGDSSASR